MQEPEVKNFIKADLGPLYEKGYGKIFSYSLFDARLNRTERAVMVYFGALLPSDGLPRVFPGIENIKTVLGCGINQVYSSLDTLYKVDFVRLVKEKGKRKNGQNSFDHNTYIYNMIPKGFKNHPDHQKRQHCDIRDYGREDIPLKPILDKNTGVNEIVMWGLICYLSGSGVSCTIDEIRTAMTLGLSACSKNNRTGQQYKALSVLSDLGYISFTYDPPKKKNGGRGSFFVKMLNRYKDVTNESDIQNAGVNAEPVKITKNSDMQNGDGTLQDTEITNIRDTQISGTHENDKQNRDTTNILSKNITNNIYTRIKDINLSDFLGAKSEALTQLLNAEEKEDIVYSLKKKILKENEKLEKIPDALKETYPDEVFDMMGMIAERIARILISDKKYFMISGERVGQEDLKEEAVSCTESLGAIAISILSGAAQIKNPETYLNATIHNYSRSKMQQRKMEEISAGYDLEMERRRKEK